LCNNLERAEYHTVSIANGQSVIRPIRQESPDLLVLDLAMFAGTSSGNGLDGRAICRQVRQISEAPILALTTSVEEAEQTSNQQVCADD
jgi:two-component system response regulator BaeR